MSDGGEEDVPEAQISSLEGFTESDFWLEIKDIQIGSLIGSGQFSKVYVGRYFGDLVAVKIQKREGKALETYLLRELAVLKNARHENLIAYLGAYNEVTKHEDDMFSLYIITEFCQNGDLLSLLVDASKILGWKFRLKIALQASSAIRFLHEHNLLHRDIKSSNFLLDSHWNCKISDFGMSRELNGVGPRR